MSSLNEKAQPIRAIITDVDGVLTDGGIIYDNLGNELKRFNVKDGMIVRPLREMGFIVGAITGRKAEVVKRRLDELGLDFHFHGISQKIEQYEAVKDKLDLKDQEIAYIGDDGNDLRVMQQCGLSACPADAARHVRERADITLPEKGGQGAFRAFAELILGYQNRLDALLPYWGVGE